MRVALVHDWLTGMRGGEKCLEVLCELFPRAPIYTLVHVKGSVSSAIESHRIFTSFVQRLPGSAKGYRSYLPLFPAAIESFDFSPYDLIISSSHCVAKGARPAAGALHLCYCHTPMRYVWDMYDSYFGPGQAGTATRLAMAFAAPRLRRWDVRTTGRVTAFIANSEHVRERIGRIYERPADVIYPPVDVGHFSPGPGGDGDYLIVSALVPYKRVDIAVEAFSRTDRRLLIVGKGPEEARLRARASANVQFLGWRSDEELAVLYRGCRALVFPGEEDFGIVPVEAMASGKPVIAFGKGGALETVVEGKTGLFFHEQTPAGLGKKIEEFERTHFDAEAIRGHALRFSRHAYREKMNAAVEGLLESRDDRSRASGSLPSANS